MRGIENCHKNSVLHRDLKPQNILVDRHGNVKLADFGLARYDTIPMKGYTNEVITLWYRPPEVLLGSRKYRGEIDMWSVGCIMAELILGKPLFIGQNEEGQISAIFSVLGLPTPDEWPDMEYLPDWEKYDLKVERTDEDFDMLLQRCDGDGLDLLMKMLSCNPQTRILSTEALSHGWFMSKVPSYLHDSYASRSRGEDLNSDQVASSFENKYLSKHMAAQEKQRVNTELDEYDSPQTDNKHVKGNKRLDYAQIHKRSLDSDNF